MTIHETRTPLAPAEVIERARSFFTHAGTPYAAFAEQAGDGFLKLHLEVGEIVIAALPQGDSTWVRGSASRGAHLLTRFLTTLAPSLDAKQTTHRRGLRRTRAAQVETLADRDSAPTESGARPAAQAA
jgi:hypothetical protein